MYELTGNHATRIARGGHGSGRIVRAFHKADLLGVSILIFAGAFDPGVVAANGDCGALHLSLPGSGLDHCRCSARQNDRNSAYSPVPWGCCASRLIGLPADVRNVVRSCPIARPTKDVCWPAGVFHGDPDIVPIVEPDLDQIVETVVPRDVVRDLAVSRRWPARRRRGYAKAVRCRLI